MGSDEESQCPHCVRAQEIFDKEINLLLDRIIAIEVSGWEEARAQDCIYLMVERRPDLYSFTAEYMGALEKVIRNGNFFDYPVVEKILAELTACRDRIFEKVRESEV